MFPPLQTFLERMQNAYHFLAAQVMQHTMMVPMMRENL